MKAICVDDEILIASHIEKILRQLPQIDDVNSFTGSRKALEWLETHTADLAVLDIDMPDINGVELAERMKMKCPDIAIIFLTGYEQFAMEAYALRASGYLLKPVNKDDLAAEVAYAIAGKPNRILAEVRTFGRFDVFAEGKTVLFKKEDCKELLALLVDRRGSGITRAEAFATLWEDLPYDRPMQKKFDLIIASLHETLKAYGIDGILEVGGGWCADPAGTDLL